MFINFLNHMQGVYFISGGKFITIKEFFQNETKNSSNLGEVLNKSDTFAKWNIFVT